jgi:ribokinase
MRIAVVGSYGVGLTMRVPRMPGAGETLSGGEFASGPGGKGSNQAIGMARLGASVSLLTAVGDDAFGASAFELWKAEGVDAAAVATVAAASTMVGVIVVEPSGENRIVIASGALDHLGAEDVARFDTAIAGADLLVVSMEIPESAVVAALLAGRRHGVRTLLNPAPARPLPESVWPLIDVLTPNRGEAGVLLGVDKTDDRSEESLALALADRTGGAVVLTCGGDGAVVVEAGTGVGTGVATRIEPVPVASVVDTTGAGDAFTAALAVALAEGATMNAAARFAARAGAHAVTIAEVVPSLPHRGDLEPATAS